jgi:phage terminase large subunit
LPVLTSSARFIVLLGGRDSSKSHTVARVLILKALEKKCLILCTRHIQKSIAASSYSLLVKIIKEYALDKYFHIVENEIRCLRTGAKFIFQGLWQNLDNIKSLEGVNYCWIEEAKNCSFDALRVLFPTLRAEGSQFFITFNPDLTADPVYDMFITHSRPDTLVIKINYDENPFLSDTSKKEIEYMRLNDPDNFKWIYEGNTREQSAASILTNIMMHDFEIDITKQPFYGLDFGYNDPTAITQSYVYDNELYICREFYETNLDPDQLRTKCISLEWLHGKHIIADSARPELIKMLNATGRFTVQNARKNIGQPIREGAYKYAMSLYFKQFRKIHIHESNCPNACREFPLWKWQTDKNEKILDIVADGDDHTVDATIYALERKAAEWYKNYFKH